ncbi:hypothetical protein THIOKS1860018 [Thiocapsa sp. KS1]|nr:hypothetical protein THIOKS1860018 [Thiocapsa sp. KS1]
MALSRLRRTESLRFGFDGNRELGWLFYIGAWVDPTRMAGLAGGTRPDDMAWNWQPVEHSPLSLQHAAS